MKLPLVSLSIYGLYFYKIYGGAMPFNIFKRIGKSLPVLLIFLMSALFFANYTNASSPIPFQFIGNLIVVKAKVNGHNGNFILDTGSPILILNSAYFSGFKSTDKNKGIMDIHGMELPPELLFVNSIEIQGIELRNATAKIIDLSNYELLKHISLSGILGYDSFRGKQLIFDFEKHLLHISGIDAVDTHLYSIQDSVELKMNGHLPCIAVTYGRQNYWFALDTGSELNLFHLPYLRGKGDGFRGSGRVTLKGLGNSAKKLSKVWLYQFQIGNQLQDSLEVVLTDMNSVNSKFHWPIDGLLGTAFLKEHLICIHYKRKKAYFIKAGENGTVAKY